MKLFILFVLFCYVFAQNGLNDPKENVVHPAYNPKQPPVANCKEYNADYTCKTCHEEFDLASNQCNAKTIEKGPVKTDTSKQFVHTEIGYDTKEGTCQKTINIVYANRTAIPDDKYAGSKSCLACSKYTADGTKCEICVAGYLENKGGCTPLTINPFGESNTDKACVYGKYDYTTDNENGSPQCYSCSKGHRLDNGKCIPATNINNFPEGCVKKEHNITDASNRIECRECKEGYELIYNENNGYVCEKLPTNCLLKGVVNGEKKCVLCIPGYYMSGNECTKCQATMPQSMNYFNNDECNGISPSHCQCNPNCIANPAHYQNCISRHCDLFSEKEMSPINKNNPKCLRCQQGYKLVGTAGNDTCIPCTNGCFTNEQNTTCEKGYYLTVDASNKNVCRKCEGKCKQCISKTQCLEREMYNRNELYGHALNGLPCLDGNCELCSSDNPTVCYKCKNDSLLIGGKCYIKYNEAYLAGGTTQTYSACKYYQLPDIITNPNAAFNYLNEYINAIEPAYLKDAVNKVDSTYLCKYRDFLPHYYRYYNKVLSCAGANRDKNNDCECIDSHFANSTDKTTPCYKTNVPYCKKAISETLCAQCYEGMVMFNSGPKDKPQFRCGCPQTTHRINHNGICVECPAVCATCDSVKLTNGSYQTKCLTCNGKAEYSGEEDALIAQNFNRVPEEFCKCKSGYKTFTDETDIYTLARDKVYTCYEIPRGCKEESKYQVKNFSVECTTCDLKGFTLASGCEQCDKGYSSQYQNGTNLVVNCTRCPTVYDNVTYCLDCTHGVDEANNTYVQCGECVDSNLNLTNHCKTCNQGYSMVYVNYPETDKKFVNPMPVCIKNEDYCKVLPTGTSFYAPVNATQQQYDTYKGKSKTNPYTKAEYAQFDTNYTIYCHECAGTGQKVLKNCICEDNFYRDSNQVCQNCTKDLGEKTFETIDTNGKVVTARYMDVCELITTESNKGKQLCSKHAFKDLIECKICKNKERAASTNCLECLSTTTFPVFDGTNHICKQCLAKCATCTNDKNCTSCKGAGVTGANCDQCSKGFFKSSTDSTTGAAVCTKCNSTCASCDGSATKCTSCTTANHVPGPNHDCKACEVGFYYNIATDTCNAVNSKNGFAESVVICKNKADNKTIQCTPGLTEANTIFEERPIRCDTTKGVGISPYPVNGLCVCDTGYLDNRSQQVIDNTTEKIPVCTPLKDIAKDPFCVDGKFEDNNKTKVMCKKCNADYLEIVNGKCVCKKTHYTTSWGMCVPCGRHNKGCQECTGKYVCTKCDDKAYKLGSEEKNSKGEVTRKCVGK